MTQPDLDRFEQLDRLADKRNTQADKAALPERAHVLDLGGTQARDGELPAVEWVSLAAADSLTSKLADGMVGTSWVSWEV